MKKQLTTILAAVLTITLITAPAFAGSKQRNRWEGVAIGAAAATLLGPALLAPAIIAPHVKVRTGVSTVRRGGCDYPSRGERVVYTHTRYQEPRPARHHRGNGHWETRKVWVDPVVEQVWNPGHYNKRRQWVPGHYIQIEKSPGYWTEDQVWVSRR